jgi:two-component system sensor histidine kinase ChiS
MKNHPAVLSVAASCLSRVPLRTILIVPFVVQIVATVGLVGYLSFRNGQQAVANLANQLIGEVSDRTQQHLKSYTELPQNIAQLVVDDIALGGINLRPQNLQGADRYFLKRIQTFNSVSFIYVGNQQGKFIGAGPTHRFGQRSYIIEVTDGTTAGNYISYAIDSQGNRTRQIGTSYNYDPRRRPWYKAAVQQGKATWSEIYPFIGEANQGLTITAVAPFFEPSGQLAGVTAVDLYLNDISEFLKHLSISRSGQVLILEPNGLLVGSSNDQPTFSRQNGEIKRILAVNSNDLLVRATIQHLEKQFGHLNTIQQSQRLIFSFHNQRQFVQITPWHDQHDLNWFIVAVVPESDFMTEITANTQKTILLCVLALLIAIITGIATADWVTQPILRLNRAAKDITAGNWGNPVDLGRSDEVGELATSFNTMAEQLKTSFTDLEAKNQSLQRFDQLKDEFLANTSHELRTPLNGMIGIAESMIDGAAGDLSTLQRQNLWMIAQSGHRLSNLVNDILDFSKLRHQDIQLQLQPVGLREAVEIVLMLNKLLSDQKNLILTNLVPADLPPVLADENRLQQILHNIVGNAIKFTDRGKVEISAEVISSPSRSPVITLTVSDTGIGIPADKLDRIFESFEQADGSIARSYGGTGLGLAITKQLIELHGGTIRVASTPGEGSQFTVTLPVSEVEREPVTPIAAVSEQADSDWLTAQPTLNSVLQTNRDSHVKILVVDDEPVNLQVLANLLQLQQYEVVLTASGREALTLLEQGAVPDLILLDVMMPGMTGYETTQMIRQRYAADQLPIILLSARNQVEAIVAGLEAGANDYLTKPIAKDELFARIRTYLQIRELQAETLRLTVEYSQTLEQKISQRTTELAHTNTQLEQEINERRQVERALQLSLKEKEVLLKEIHHRVKNNLQIVYSLLRLQQRTLQDPQAIASLLDSQNRIESIALIHEELYCTGNLAQIDFSDYIPKLIKNLQNTYNTNIKKITIESKINMIFLNVNQAIPCGLIVNELISNALKYAFPAEAEGHIQVTLNADEDFNITLTVRDDGIGLPKEFDLSQTNSLGLQLVQDFVAQLKGRLKIDCSPGTTFAINFPGVKHD